MKTGETGHLAAVGDADDFCRGVVHLLSQAGLRDRMSETCRARALHDHDLSDHVDKVLAVYEEARRAWKADPG